jgi:DNA polymerase I-like protein with 3'-5' exonuclease and polymerase domains
VERQAFNHIVQGLSADFMKAAIMEAWNYGLDVRLTVHDELVCYSAPENADEHSRLLEQAMINGAEKVIAISGVEWDVPIEADAHWGLSWAAAKEG